MARNGKSRRARMGFSLIGERIVAQNRPRRRAVRRVVAIATLFAASAALAQYPGKPIRLRIGYAAGGSAEAGARPLGRALEPMLGQPLVFEYRPGNAGGVAMEAIAKAPADGYTLYYFDSGPLTVAPHLGKVGYDPFKSFTQLGHVCGSGSLLVVHPSTPFRSVAEVIEASKREPNKWSYGTSGVGGSLHRSQAFPDVPTMDELGIKGFDSTAWYGILGPAGLPQEVVNKWTQVLAKAGSDKATMDLINATGCDAEILSPAKTSERIKADYEKWGRVVREANIRAE